MSVDISSQDRKPFKVIIITEYTVESHRYCSPTEAMHSLYNCVKFVVVILRWTDRCYIRSRSVFQKLSNVIHVTFREKLKGDYGSLRDAVPRRGNIFPGSSAPICRRGRQNRRRVPEFACAKGGERLPRIH